MGHSCKDKEDKEALLAKVEKDAENAEKNYFAANDRFNNAQIAFGNANQNLTEKTGILEALSSSLADAKSWLDECIANLTSSTKNYEEKMEAFNKANEKVETVKKELDALQAENKEINDAHRLALSAKVDAEKELKAKEEALKVAKEAHEKAVAEHKLAKENYEAKKAVADEAKARLDAANKALANSTGNLETLKAEQAKAQEAYDKAMADLDKANSELEAFSDENVKKAQDKLDSAKKALEEAKKAKDEADSKYGTADKNQKDAQAKFDAALKKYLAAKDKYDKLKAEHDKNNKPSGGNGDSGVVTPTPDYTIDEAIKDAVSGNNPSFTIVVGADGNIEDAYVEETEDVEMSVEDTKVDEENTESSSSEKVITENTENKEGISPLAVATAVLAATGVVGALWYGLKKGLYSKFVKRG